MKTRIINFLNEIGIRVHICPFANGFCKHVSIQGGELWVDNLTAIADLLHEAGHLAILPGRFREYANNNLEGVQKIMLEQIDFSKPDVGDARAFLQCGDVEATAWAWAAGKHLGIPERFIIRDRDYNGEGEELRDCLSMRSFFGINGLRAGGFLNSVKEYPKLDRWIQL